MLLFGAPCPTRSDAKEHGKRHDARFTGFVAKVKQRHRRQFACTPSAGADRRAFQLGLVQSCSLLGCPRSLYVPRAWVLVGPGQCGPFFRVIFSRFPPHQISIVKKIKFRATIFSLGHFTSPTPSMSPRDTVNKTRPSSQRPV